MQQRLARKGTTCNAKRSGMVTKGSRMGGEMDWLAVKKDGRWISLDEKKIER